MSAELKKIAAEVVKRAKKRAVLAEVVALVKKAVAFGMDADEKSKQVTPKGPAGVPAPARMKSEPQPTAPAKPEVSPLPPKVAADMLVAGLLVKTAEQTKTARAHAYKRATVLYAKAVKSGNKEHIKKATAHLATVITFDTMTKQALTGEIGTLIMKLLSKITPAAGWAAKKIDRPGVTNIANTITEWGKRMGSRGGMASGLLAGSKKHPEFLRKTLALLPEGAADLSLAKQIGTGALAGGGTLAASSLLD